MEITISGKVLRLRWGMYVARYMHEVLIDDMDMVEKSARLISIAHVNYVKANVNEVVQLNEREIYAAIEDATINGDAEFTEQVSKVWAAFSESALVKSALQKLEELKPDESKKKAHGKKLSNSPSV